MQAIIQMANTSSQGYRKQKLYNGYENRSSSDRKYIQDIWIIQGKEEWNVIVHTILSIGIIRALNESSGRLF